MKIRIFIALFLALILIGVVLYFEKNTEQTNNRVFDNSLTYSAQSYKPYDTKFFHDEIKKNAKGFDINKEPIDSINKKLKGSGSLYVVASPYFLPNENERNQLFEYIESGNDVFVSSFSMSESFLNTLFYSETNRFFIFNYPPIVRPDAMKVQWADSTHQPYSYDGFYPIISSFESPTLNPSGIIEYEDVEDEDTAEDSVAYDEGVNYAKIEKDTTIAEEEILPQLEEKNKNLTVHSYDNEGNPQLVSIERGKGKIYLLANPISLTNYFVLHQQNYSYLNSIIETLGIKNKKIIWDNFYYRHSYERPYNNNYNERESYFWKLLMEHPPLMWAFWTFLGAIVLFVLVHYRRTVKPVKVLPIVENDSMAFVNAISRLYWVQQDHHSIAEKLKNQFLDYLANNYRIYSKDFTRENLLKITQKTGRSESLITDIINGLEYLENTNAIDNDTLSNLYKNIYKFYHPH